jgi:hypothetical protein
MPRTLTSGFDDINAIAQKIPRVAFSVSGVTRTYSSGPYSGENTTNNKRYIAAMEADILDIDVKRGFSDSGKIRLTMLDTDLDVTEQMIVDNNLATKTGDVTVGYEELALSDFVSLAPSKMVDFINKANPVYVDVVLGDAKRFISRTDTIFNNLAVDRINDGTGFSATDTLLVVDDAESFVDPDNFPAELYWIAAMVKVSNAEIMNYTTRSTIQFTCNGRGTDNYGSTPPQSHEDEAEVSQAFGANRDPSLSKGGWLRFLASILLTRKSSGQSAGHTLYDLTNHDTNFMGFGLGLTTDDVDLDSFESMDCFVSCDTKNLADNDHGRGFIVHETQNARQWISILLRQLGCFFYINGDGKLAVGVHDYIWNDRIQSSQGTITNDDITSGVMDVQFDEIENMVELAWDKNFLSGGTAKENKYRYAESVTAYDRSEETFKIESDVLDKGCDEANVQKWMYRFFMMFANPPVAFTLQTLIKNIKYLPGDKVQITCDRFKDLRSPAPTQGWTTRNSLITGQKIVWAGSKPVLEMKGFSWEPLHKVDLATDIVGVTKANTDMDRSAALFTGTNSATLEAADAYIDYSDTTHCFVFEVRIDASSSGGSGERKFDISFWIQTVGPVTTLRQFSYQNVRVLSGEAAFTRYFRFTEEWGTDLAHDRIKIDVYNFDDWDATGGLSNYPTVSVQNIYMFDLSNMTLTAE